MSQVNVIKYLRQKNDSDYDAPVWLGAEQRYVGPIRGSGGNLNNLEEQFIIGTNTYTLEKEEKNELEEKDDKIIIKSFCSDPEVDNNFYQLQTVIHNIPHSDEDEQFDFVDDIFVIPYGNRMEYYQDPETLEWRLECVVISGDEGCNFDTRNSQFNVFPQYEMVLQEDKLYFVKTPIPLEEVLVISKQTRVRVNSADETITREIVVNEIAKAPDGD